MTHPVYGSGTIYSAEEDDMALPAGKSCADCKHFERCVAFIGPRHIHDKQTRCDWAPSRFRLHRNQRATPGERGVSRFLQVPNVRRGDEHPAARRHIAQPEGMKWRLSHDNYYRRIAVAIIRRFVTTSEQRAFRVTHQWSGWPGAYCMKCGQPNPIEAALFCKDGCDLKAHPGDTASDTICPMHEAWAKALATCPPTKEAIADLKAKFPQLFAASHSQKEG